MRIIFKKSWFSYLVPPNAPEASRFYWISVFGILLSVFWVMVCSALCRDLDATRGGALTVALSFAMLFMARGVSLNTLNKLWPSALTLDSKVELIKNHLDLDPKFLKRQNVYLAISSVTGTIFWGFGDWFSIWFRHSILFVAQIILTAFGACNNS